MKVSENIKKILSDKGFTQAMLAEALGKDNATISRILNETQELRLSEIENIAKALGVSVIDLFTYPKQYVDKQTLPNADKVMVTFEVSPEKRDELLNMVIKDK